jgi:hypothetical protein
MSSLKSPDNTSLFVVQTGIVAWEDPQPIVGWKWKTVSIVLRELSSSLDLLRAVVASRPTRVRRVQRFYLAPISSSMTEMQKRRLVANLKKDPPGFSDTTLNAEDDRICVISTLSDELAIDLHFLTSHRRCALIELEDDFELRNLRRDITDLGGAGINAILNHRGAAAVVRVLEMQSHATVQLIGATETADLAVSWLVENGIKQFHDLRALPKEIASFRA